MIGRLSGWLGLPSRSSAPAPGSRGPGGRLRKAGRWLRGTGRWLVVHTWASAAFRPGRWAAGLGIAALAVSPVAAGVAVAAPFGALVSLSILTRSDHRSFLILSAASSRVKSLKLARRLRRRWSPLMVRLGLSREVQRRDKTVTLVPRLGRIRLSHWGVHVPVNLQPLDQAVSVLGNLTERIESGLAVRDCTIRKAGPGRATMDLRHSDPLAEIIRVDELPEPTRYLRVVPRRAEDGTGVEQPLPPLHLEVGATRAGKSQAAWTLIKLILDKGIPLRLRIFDPKAQEFVRLANVAYDYESDVTRWPEFLGRAFAALKARQSSLAKRGISELRHFTDSDPLDLMILDEFLSVLAMRNAEVKVGSQTMKASSVLDQYASQCLAAGYGMVAAAQLGQKDIIGAVRDLFPTASILRVPPQASEMVNAVLGPDAAKRYPAHLIPFGRHTAGQGYTRTPSGLVLRTRVAYLSDDERAELVEDVRAETARFGGPYRTRRKQRETAGAAAA